LQVAAHARAKGMRQSLPGRAWRHRARAWKMATGAFVEAGRRLSRQVNDAAL